MGAVSESGPRSHENAAQIGIWRSESELRELVAKAGWKLEIATMPKEYYAAHYRFDAILTR